MRGIIFELILSFFKKRNITIFFGSKECLVLLWQVPFNITIMDTVHVTFYDMWKYKGRRKFSHKSQVTICTSKKKGKYLLNIFISVSQVICHSPLLALVMSLTVCVTTLICHGILDRLTVIVVAAWVLFRQWFDWSICWLDGDFLWRFLRDIGQNHSNQGLLAKF